MKFNPLAVVTTLAVAAAGTFGVLAMKQDKIVTPVTLAVPIVKSEEKVAIVTQPVPVPPIVQPVTPSFDTVRVETTGEAVIAGRALPSTEVVAKLNGQVIASATTMPDGSFVVIPAKPLPAGAGTLSLETKQGDKTLVSKETVAVAVKPHGQGETTVAVLSPAQPTKIIQAAPTKSVVLDAVDYDALGNITFSGRAEANAAVRLYVDNAIAGEVKANDLGTWNFVGQNKVLPGTHTLRVDQIAVDGTVSSRAELPFLREEPEKVALAPVPAPDEKIASAQNVAAAPAIAQPTRIVIQPGNSLWKISRDIYGLGRNYTVIYEANKDLIKNPRLIYPGQIITAPVAIKQ